VKQLVVPQNQLARHVARRELGPHGRLGARRRRQHARRLERGGGLGEPLLRARLVRRGTRALPSGRRCLLTMSNASVFAAAHRALLGGARKVEQRDLNRVAAVDDDRCRRRQRGALGRATHQRRRRRVIGAHRHTKRRAATAASAPAPFFDLAPPLPRCRRCHRRRLRRRPKRATGVAARSTPARRPTSSRRGCAASCRST
jgi:hypothetical protein